MNEKKYLEDICTWLIEQKGITQIDLLALAEFVPEYEEYLEKSNHKN